jgi:hypothetical protein
MTNVPLRGRWAQGLRPRLFLWVIKDRLAASERPGGFARTHRRIRRQEELIWLHQQGFTKIVSLLDSPHNLHAYAQAGLAYEHLPLGRRDQLPERLPAVYGRLESLLAEERARLLVHHEEFSELMLGVLAGYLYCARLVEDGPQAVLVMERLSGRELGARGREVVTAALASGWRAGQ